MRVGDYDGDGRADVYAVQRNDQGATAIHVLNAATNFQNYLQQTRTPLVETTAPEWDFGVGDFNADGRADVYAFNKSDSGRTAVHVLDASSGFQVFAERVLTAIEATTDPRWSLRVGDYNGDRKADIYALNSNDQGKTAVHVLDADSDFQIFTDHVLSVLHATDDGLWDLQVSENGRPLARLSTAEQQDFASEAAGRGISVDSLKKTYATEFSKPTGTVRRLPAPDNVAEDTAPPGERHDTVGLTAPRATGSGSGPGDIPRVRLRPSMRAADMFYYPSYTYGINHGHIGLYRWKSTVIEAANENLGVIMRDISVRPNVPVGTLILEDLNTTKAQRQAIASWAATKAGMSYRGFTSPNRKMTAPYNCSQLVWAAYKSQGFDIDKDGGLWVLPRDIVENGADGIGYYDSL